MLLNELLNKLLINVNKFLINKEITQNDFLEGIFDTKNFNKTNYLIDDQEILLNILQKISENEKLKLFLASISFNERYFATISLILSGDSNLQSVNTIEILWEIFKGNNSFIHEAFMFLINDNNLSVINNLISSGMKATEYHSDYAFKEGKFELALLLRNSLFEDKIPRITPELRFNKTITSDSEITELFKSLYKGKLEVNYYFSFNHSKSRNKIKRKINKIFFEQINFLLDIINKSMLKLELPNSAEIKTKLYERLNGDYFIKNQSINFGAQVKRNLESICYFLLSKKISPFTKKKILMDLSEQIDVCQTGFFATLEDIKNQLSVNYNDILSLINNNREIIINNYVAIHMEKNGFLLGNLPHVKYFFMSYLKTKGYTFTAEDVLNEEDKFATEKVTNIYEKDLEDFLNYFEANDTLENHVYNTINFIFADLAPKDIPNNEKLNLGDIESLTFSYDTRKKYNEELSKVELFSGIKNVDFFSCINSENLLESPSVFKFNIVDFQLAIISRFQSLGIFQGKFTPANNKACLLSLMWFKYAKNLEKALNDKDEVFLDILINAKHSDGTTALYWLAEKNIYKYIEFLEKALKKPQDNNLLNTLINAKYGDGTTALYWLAEKNIYKYIEFLEKALKKPQDSNLLNALINAKCGDGTTALYWLTEKNIYKYIKFLEKALKEPQDSNLLNALINAKRGEGTTALFWLAEKNIYKYIEFLEKALKEPQDNNLFNALISAKHSYGTTALYWLAEKNTNKYIELLEKALKEPQDSNLLNALINAKHSCGTTALFWLAEKNIYKYIELLEKALKEPQDNNLLEALINAEYSLNNNSSYSLFSIIDNYETDEEELLNIIKEKNHELLKTILSEKNRATCSQIIKSMRCS